MCSRWFHRINTVWRSPGHPLILRESDVKIEVKTCLCLGLEEAECLWILFSPCLGSYQTCFTLSWYAGRISNVGRKCWWSPSLSFWPQNCYFQGGGKYFCALGSLSWFWLKFQSCLSAWLYAGLVWSSLSPALLLISSEPTIILNL